MAELTLLLPPRARVDAKALPLAAWTTRGDALRTAPAGRDALVRGSFEFIGTSIPVAALTRSLDARDAAGALWLRADPAWLAADAVTLRMLACGNLQLSREECAALARPLQPLFGDAGFPLEATTPERWYLRCPRGAQLPQFAAPADVLGDDVARHLPQGDGARRWEHLLNEAQVILHNHPVNAQRARRGAAPVNSIWPWGAGILPDFVRTPHTRVHSADIVVRALAARAGIPCDEAIPEDFAVIPADAHLLLDLADRRDATALAAAQRALEQRRVDAVDVRFESGERLRYRHSHRWRFWRRLPRAARA